MEEKEDYARILYMGGENQTAIAEKVGVSRQTVNKWVNLGDWEKKRAAKSVTRPELVNNLLEAIAKELEALNNETDPLKKVSAGDRLAKLGATLERLDKKANVVDCVEVFMSFSQFLQSKANNDPELTVGFLKKVNHYQDMFINALLAINK